MPLDLFNVAGLSLIWYPRFFSRTWTCYTDVNPFVYRVTLRLAGNSLVLCVPRWIDNMRRARETRKLIAASKVL